MYTANGIKNNYLYVDLRISGIERVKLILDDVPLLSGTNESGDAVFPDAEKKWSAGRLAFPLSDGSHTLLLQLFDTNGETPDIPPQPIFIRKSFNCVILDSARRGVWRSEPDEYFGRGTHARSVLDGSYINAKDNVPAGGDPWHEHIVNDSTRYNLYETNRELAAVKLGLTENVDFDKLYRLAMEKKPEAQYMLASS